MPETDIFSLHSNKIRAKSSHGKPVVSHFEAIKDIVPSTPADFRGRLTEPLANTDGAKDYGQNEEESNKVSYCRQETARLFILS